MGKYKYKKNSRSRSRSHSPGRKSRRRHDSSSPESPRDRNRRKEKRKDAESKERVDRHVMSLEDLKEKRRKEKELMKAYETPEEKRARRLAKKELKEKKRKADMGWDKETLTYTNEDNPFGDHNLTSTFVWKSKLKKEGLSLEDADVAKMNRAKMEESKRELEKVKKRQQEREREKEARDREREMEQREKESDYYSAWEKQEDNFHLDQAKERSKIRIEDGRAKPIDLLAKYINAEDDDMSVEMHEPYTYLVGLSIIDLEDLLEDIKVYLELEKGKNQDYWRDVTTITEDQLSQLRRHQPAASTSYDMRDRREGIHTAVSSDVDSVFKGKTLKQLSILQDQIRSKLKGGEGVDVGYWESLLQQLKAHIALTKLKEQHQVILKKRLAKLKQEQALERADSPKVKLEGEFKEPLPPKHLTSLEGSNATDDASTAASTSHASQDDSEAEEVLPAADETEGDEEDEYDAGRCSPRLLPATELEEGTLVYNPEDDMKRLELQRLSLRQTGKVQRDGDSALVQRARDGMTNDEVRFSVEYNLEQQSFVWSDKYRPRKPRFFNRVHTGFEWNKYNQTHYDMDNPPPKIVQGYKFNIFYPDLIDKTNTPQYSVIPIEDDPDFSVLKFSAGPPYEDIAFKIVNREWEYSYKHGFKCQFHNDIFQLWFHFRRYRYRR
ncbi:splicing factor Cactin-like [Watersipora subatra]|uniref:splicing factor Cactin-like n=1 Tax=Watersipora subatra TaxID=2589382 RepID=UPI00355B845A